MFTIGAQDVEKSSAFGCS